MYLEKSRARKMALVSRTKLSGLGNHLGIQIDDKTIHNTVEQGVTEVTFDKFSAGKDVHIIYQIPPDEQQAALRRAAEMLNTRLPYRILDNNCETTGYYIAGLGSQSPQVKSAAFVLLIGGLAWYLNVNSRH